MNDNGARARRPCHGEVDMSATGVRMFEAARKVELFVTDTGAYQVLLVQVDDQEFVRGLPIFRAGTWNGKTYTVENLRAIAANFRRIEAATFWTPPLKSMHTYDWETGYPQNVPADEVVMGWFTDLYFDETSQVLFGDVRVVDYDLMYGMRRGQLKWISAEIAGEYDLPEEEESIGPALVGAAWVDNPGVKGLPWEIVMNAEAVAELRGEGAPDGNGAPPRRAASRPTPATAGGAEAPPLQTTRTNGRTATATNTDARRSNAAATKGATRMKLIEAIKRLFGAAGVSDEDLAVLDQVDEGGDEGGETPPEAPAGAPAAQQQAQGLSPEAQALLAQERKAREELQGQVEQLTAEQRRSQAEKLVDELVSGGHLPPAQRPAAYALIHGALTSGATVTMLRSAAEGQEPTEQQVPVTEALRELITGQNHAAKFADGPGLLHDQAGPADPSAPEPVSEERLNRIAGKTEGATG